VASKKDRQRKRARDAHQRRTERRAAQVKRQQQWAVGSIAAVVVVAVGLLITAVAGGFSTASAKPAAAASHSLTTTPPATPAATASPAPSPSNTAAMVDGECQYIKGGTAARAVNLPPATPDTKATYVATIATNRGNVVIDLMNNGAPCTVNSFVSLADQKYFNNTPCHRLTTAASGIYVLQCGDPTGTGDGVPGYGFGTENTASLKLASSTAAVYPAGVVAMANTGQPDSNGSQFFLVYKNTDLPPSYTPFGTIVSGLNIIQNVAKAGSDNSNGSGDGHPKEKVQIESVTISKT
jgi:peptidyl-prolyl cis-trans isomerase B (cyclophilin B)